MTTKQEPNNAQKHKVTNPTTNELARIKIHKNTHKKKQSLNQQAVVHL